jgi:hypothetical protein
LIGHSLGAHDVLSIIFLCRNILLPIVTCWLWTLSLTSRQ